MFLTLVTRTAKFGTPIKLRGIITVKISAFEQRAFATCIEKGIPNIFRRCKVNAPIVLPPFIAGALIYTGVNYLHIQMGRKNPNDYKDDE